MKKFDLTTMEKRGIMIAITIGVAIVMLLLGTIIGGAVTGQQLKEERRTVDRLEEQNSQYKADLEALQEDYDSLKRRVILPIQRMLLRSKNFRSKLRVLRKKELTSQKDLLRTLFSRSSTKMGICIVWKRRTGRSTLTQDYKILLEMTSKSFHLS